MSRTLGYFAALTAVSAGVSMIGQRIRAPKEALRRRGMSFTTRIVCTDAPRKS